MRSTSIVRQLLNGMVVLCLLLVCGGFAILWCQDRLVADDLARRGELERRQGDAIERLAAAASAGDIPGTEGDSVEAACSDKMLAVEWIVAEMSLLNEEKLRQEAAFARAHRWIKLLGVAYAALGAAVLFVVVRFALRRLALPLRRLADAADGIAAGGRDADFKPLTRRDELGVLSVSLHRMMHRLQEREAAIQRLNDELREKNKDLEQLVYVVSHDLRSPLINIQGFSKELERHFGHIRERLLPELRAGWTGNDETGRGGEVGKVGRSSEAGSSDEAGNSDEAGSSDEAGREEKEGVRKEEKEGAGGGRTGDRDGTANGVGVETNATGGNVIGTTAEQRDISGQKLLAELEEDIPEAFRYIFASTNKMDVLLTGLLQLSRLGRESLRPEKLNMNAMMRNILHTFEFRIQQSDVEVLLDPLPDCVADASMMDQMLSNVVDNALKHLQPGRRGRLRISGLRRNGDVVFCVEDNGVGIEAQYRETVFRLFEKLDPAVDGYGIGLSIAQKVAERHKGSIWVESVPGAGSAFYMRLPADGEAAPAWQPAALERTETQ